MTPGVLAILLGGSYDVAALDWRARVRANGGTTNPRSMLAVSNFAKAAKAANIWSKLSRINLMCGTDLAAARTPLVVGGGSAIETIVNVVAGDYAETGVSGGIKGNGVDKSIDTGWAPSARGADMNNFGIWRYTKGLESGAPSKVSIGGQSAGGDTTYLGWVNGGTVEAGALGVTGSPLVPNSSVDANTAAKEGFTGVATNGSRAMQYYHNGAAVGPTATATGAAADGPLRIMAFLTASSVVGNWSNLYFRGYAFTGGMSAADVAAFNTAMQAFQATLGRNV